MRYHRSRCHKCNPVEVLTMEVHYRSSDVHHLLGHFDEMVKKVNSSLVEVTAIANTKRTTMATEKSPTMKALLQKQTS